MKLQTKFSILLLFLPVIFLYLLISQCSYRGDSVGQGDKIVVFADSVDWPYYKDALNSVFGEYKQTPVLEREFILDWVPFRNFKHYQKQKNIFILGRLNSDLPVSSNVRDLLNDEVIEGVKSGKYFYIPKPNAWALNQYLLILVANNRDDMVQKIHDLGELMYSNFKNYYYNRLEDEMFARMEQKKLEKYIADHFPFSIRVQHDYFIADENLKENYVWIRRMQPDRSLLIHWLPYPGDENFELTSNWVIEERNRVAKKIYSGDKVVKEETKAFRTEFNDHPALKLEGTWRNDSLVIGGPFRDISFIDKDTNRIYMIDYYVQAIGKRKLPYLDQLYVIAHTFKVRKEPQLKAKGE
jgi:hypothetical protein